MKVSIVMANYNRRKLLINSLKSIQYYNKDRDIEVIIVDDASSKQESIIDIPDLFSIPIVVIPITKEEKHWTYDGIPFNIGFSYARGELIIIQNPENFHVGDIVAYAQKYIRKNIFLSFALYSMNQADTDNLYKKAISKNILQGEKVLKIISPLVGRKEVWTDGDTCWYNHSLHQPAGHHLISAILKTDLEELGGFDERYAHGFAYSDFELRERMKKKGMITKIVDYPFAIHQRHELSAYIKMAKEFRANAEMFNNVTSRERGFRAPANRFFCPSSKILYKTGKTISLDKCPITGDTTSIEFLNLGNVPLVNNLCNNMNESLIAPRFPLAIQLFTTSRLTCLTDSVNKDSIFLNYSYRSGINKPFLKHCSQMFSFLNDIIDIKPKDVIIDIGGNDGSLLLEFKALSKEPDYINIDASRSFIEINERAGLKYVNKFFDEKFVLPGKKAKVIISTNVFQHTLPIRSFVKGIRSNIAADGIWCLEFPYLLTTMLVDNYDQIYHEHVYYYLLSNIVDLLDQEGMKVINVSFHNIHAGTLRVISVLKENKRDPDNSVKTFLSLENILTDEFYIQWGSRTHEKIDKFKTFINNLNDRGSQIACFGAAAKGCVFLNTCELDYRQIKFIIDDTPYKQGKFVPGTGLKIVGRDILKTEKIEYMIILAHNFKDYIIESLKGQYDGKFIIMFPDIKVI